MSGSLSNLGGADQFALSNLPAGFSAGLIYPTLFPQGAVCFEGTTAQIGCAGELAAQGQGSWVMFKCCDMGPRGAREEKGPDFIKPYGSSHKTAFMPVFYPGDMTFIQVGR